MYEHTDDVDTERWRTEHENGDETVVLLVEADDRWLVIVSEFDEDDDPLTTETLAICATREEAMTRAEEWTAENPKGLLYDENHGVLAKLGLGGST